MTPRQFDALLRRNREHQLRLEFGAAIICQTIHGLAGVKTPHTNFMPSWRGKIEQEPDWEQLLAKTKVLHAAYGGV
jgi:hypothetical protein